MTELIMTKRGGRIQFPRLPIVYEETTWQERALCASEDITGINFMPERFSQGRPRKGAREDVARPARQVCLRCPVRQDCFDYAVAARLDGIWGGTWFSLNARQQQERYAY